MKLGSVLIVDENVVFWQKYKQNHNLKIWHFSLLKMLIESRPQRKHLNTEMSKLMNNWAILRPYMYYTGFPYCYNFL